MKPDAQTSRWLAPSPPSVAIEIAAGRVTVVELGSGAQPAIVAYATETLPADAVTPALTGANISKPDVVAGALKVAFDRAGLRPPRRAALVVPDAIARLSLLPFEQLPARAVDLEKLVRWQLRKSMPFPIDEAQVSTFVASRDERGTVVAAVSARRDVVDQYEGVAASLGIHAGVVDLSSLNVMNTLMGGPASAAGDQLLVCLAREGTTLAILRGDALMFYRHRGTVDEEPLSALVHQTAMFHEDRLGGSAFARIWISGAALAPGGSDVVRRELAQLGVPAELVDVRARTSLAATSATAPAVLDALAAPVGVLLRERKAA
jgi:Tfp pilus assembly PilM family ATPase